MKKQKYILDSYALLAYLQGETSGLKVRGILNDASSGSIKVFLTTISHGEIYYIITRKRGNDTAQTIIKDISNLPVDLVEATKERILAAALVKAFHPVSYADAFVVAAAAELSATIVTGDPEFKETESKAPVLWI